MAGDEILEIFNNFVFKEDESGEDYKTVVEKFDNYWSAQTNEVYERYVFRKRMQAAGETFEHFVRDVRKQARQCNFEGLADSMIRDQIVIGIYNETLRTKLLQDNQLTMAKAEQICKAFEAAALQNEAWAQKEQIDPMQMTQEKRWPQGKPRCSKCGRVHKPRNCPAYGKTCRVCQSKNHFAACCRKAAQVSELRDDEDDFSILDVCVDCVGTKRD